MPVRKILERRPIYCGRRLLTLGMTDLTITASAAFPADIAEQAVAQAEGSRPRAGRAAAAAALEAGRGKLRPLRHEAQHDGAGGSALDEDVLAEAAPMAPGAPRAR